MNGVDLFDMARAVNVHFITSTWQIELTQRRNAVIQLMYLLCTRVLGVLSFSAKKSVHNNVDNEIPVQRQHACDH